MRDFLSPPASYAPLLQWYWNGALRDEVLSRQLTAIKNAGCGGAVLRPWPGHGSAYLGDDWLSAVRGQAAVFRQLGLEAWIGDDVGSQSGSCGGRIPKELPDLGAQFLKICTEEVSAKLAVGWKFPMPTGRLLYAVAVPLNQTSGRPELARAISLSHEGLDRAPVFIARLSGPGRVYIFSHEHDDYIDLMTSEAAWLFLKSTHERYRTALKDYFGDTVAGFYCSEPTLYHETATATTQVFPWSAALETSFQSLPSHDAFEWLPALVANAGDESVRYRLEFWDAVQANNQTGFWQPLREWAQAARLQYSGGLVASDSLSGLIARHGDAAAVLASMQRPGVRVDGLQDDTGGSARHPHARLAVAVATLRGCNRVLAEPWGDCGWSATLNDRLPSLNRLLQYGFNCFAPHGAQVSIRGSRKRAPAHSATHQPYWAQWGEFGGYLARSAYAMASSTPATQVALLWPHRSALAHYTPSGHRHTRWIEEDLASTMELLDELHFDFLFLPEDDLAAASIDDGKLVCGLARHRFSLLVLPSITCLTWAAWLKLEQFVAHGGKVVCLGLLPRWSEFGRDSKMETAVVKATNIALDDLYHAYAAWERDEAQSATNLGYPICNEDRSGGRLCCYQPRLNADADDARLRVLTMLKESLTPVLETQTRHLVFNHRRVAIGAIAPAEEPRQRLGPLARAMLYGEESDEAAEAAPEAEAPAPTAPEAPPEVEDFLPGGDLFYLYNASDESTRANLRLRPLRMGTPHLLDAWTGAIGALPVWMPYPEQEGGGLNISLDFAPREARMLWVRPHAPAQQFKPVIERANFEVIDFDGMVAHGYATQNVEPKLALRHGGPDSKLVWHGAPEVVVPPPVMVGNEWSMRRVGPNVANVDDWQWQGGRRAPGEGRWFGRDRWRPMPARDVAAPIGSAGDFFKGLVTFQTTFTIAEKPQSLYLQFDALDVPTELLIDGGPLSQTPAPFPDDPPWDEAQWLWFDLGRLGPGVHTVSCVADYRDASAMTDGAALLPELMRLVGDFSVDARGAIGAATALEFAPGSWHDGGLPFYSGAVSFTQWVTLPAAWKQCRVWMEFSQMRDAIALWMNGKSCGVRVAAPYRFDVTEQAIRGGSNEILLRVWNTAEAALESHLHPPAPSGLLGPVRLVAYPMVHAVTEERS